jgi:hypothetical protein
MVAMQRAAKAANEKDFTFTDFSLLSMVVESTSA